MSKMFALAFAACAAFAQEKFLADYPLLAELGKKMAQAPAQPSAQAKPPAPAKKTQPERREAKKPLYTPEAIRLYLEIQAAARRGLDEELILPIAPLRFPAEIPAPRHNPVVVFPRPARRYYPLFDPYPDLPAHFIVVPLAPNLYDVLTIDPYR